MKTNLHLQDEIYRTVGEEIARNEFHPGPMARAMAESSGDQHQLRSLYVRFRFEELSRQVELQRTIEANQRTDEEAAITCPSCGHRGKPVVKTPGNVFVAVLLLILFIVPGVIYLMVNVGTHDVCSKCGRLLKRNFL